VEIIKFLPSSSIKLETELTRLGELLIQTSHEFAFDEKVLGMHETHIIEAFIIEFLMDIKFEFKTVLAMAELTSREVGLEDAENLPKELVFHTYRQAQALGLSLKGVSGGLIAKVLIDRLKSRIKIRLHELRHVLREKRTPKTDFPSGEVDFLLAGYYLNNVHVLLPLVEELQKIGKTMLYLATRLETYRDLVKRNIPNLGYMGNRSGVRYEIDQRKLDQFLNIFFTKFSARWKTNKYFEGQFRKKLVQRINHSTGWYAGFKKIFDQVRPKTLVLNTGSAPDSRLLIQMAKNRGIHDFVIVHGLFNDTPLLNFQNMTYKFVWSKYQASLINKYNPAIKCIVSGSPKHDALLKKFQQAPGPSPYKKPFVLFPTTPPNNVIIDQQTYNSILLEIMKTAKRLPEIFFVVKLHPTEKITAVQAFVEKSGYRLDNLIVTKTEDTYKLLYHCDLVFVVASTVGFEALLFQKKTIAYNFNPDEKWYPFSPGPKFRFIDNFKSFASDVREMLDTEDPASHDEREYYFTSGDGLKIIEEYLINDHVANH
jgi:hypothetical protein